MYRVVIADDEPWVLESLRKRVPWEREGYRIAATAEDGESALSTIESIQPDLVVTDIRMPGFSGLDLIRQARDRGYRGAFVVVSGYAEFAYAQKALRYGVIGYCLKPVEVDEIVSILRRHARSLERDAGRLLRVSDAVVEAADGGDGTALFAHFAPENPDRRVSGPLRVIVYDADQIDPAVRSAGLVTTNIGSSLCATILADESYRKMIPAADDPADDPAGDERTPMGVSGVVRDSSELHRGMLEAIVAYNHGFMGWTQSVVEFDVRQDPAALRGALRTIEEGVKARSAEAVQRGFSELRAAVFANRYHAVHAAFVYNSVVYFLDSSGHERGEPLVEYEDLVDLYGSFDLMLGHLAELCLDAVCSGPFIPQSADSRADEVVRYVDANYIGRISLGDLATRFAMSPSHLSRVFKNRTGRTLTEYVAHRRIDYAKELLETSTMPVSEIAEESGYDSYFYFARVFRRLTGQTPTEHRASTHSYENGPAG